MDNLIESGEIDKLILEFLYYESATFTINYAQNFIINKENVTSETFIKEKNKDKKRIDDINVVIKSYLDAQSISLNDDLLLKGKICSLISLIFNLSSHKEVSEKLISLFLEISQSFIKLFLQSDFWYDLFLYIQVQMIIELNGIVKRPVPIITKAVFNEYQNHEIFSLIPIHKLKYYSSRKNDIINELENMTMDEVINKYNYTQFLKYIVEFFNIILKEFQPPKLLLYKPNYI